MEEIPTILQYNGFWNEETKFVGYEIAGILLPRGCNFATLLGILSEKIELMDTNDSFDIKFQLREEFPILEIKDDSSMKFYMVVKEKENEITAHPLCVTMKKSTQPLLTYTQHYAEDCSTYVQGENSICLQQSGNFDLCEENDEVIEYARFLCKLTDANYNHSEQNVNEESVIEPCIISSRYNHNIEEGQVYKSKRVLMTALSVNAINNHYEFKVKKSCSTRYLVRCVSNKCNWQLYASSIGKSENFKIRRLIDVHTCPLDTRIVTHTQATSRLIGQLIQSKYDNRNSNHKPADIIRDMRIDYGVTINYVKAWRSREIALETKRGLPGASYSKLPTYLYVLSTTNPGSVVDLVVDENGAFCYVYFALAASIHGWKFCRPTVIVDGTFLTSAYRGTLISACTHDAAGKIFPLAFAIVDSENNSSWEWFFQKFRQTYGVRNGMCIISDRHESIDIAARLVYPEVEHCLCIYHLLNNLKGHFKRNASKISKVFLASAYAYTLKEYDGNMNEIEKVSKEIRDYLEGVGNEKWSRVFAKVNRGTIMTSNSAESMNSSHREVKDLPITALLEYLHGLVQDWTHKRRIIARDTFTTLTTKYEDVLRQNHHKSLRMKVQPSIDWLYSVMDKEENFVVDIEKKTCSCRKFQVDELPCSYALAVINTKCLNAYEFCSHYYTKATMVEFYAGVVYPTGNKSDWKAPSEVANKVVRPPVGRTKSGRPKKHRYRAIYEMRQKKKCSICGLGRHNRKTCRNLPKNV